MSIEQDLTPSIRNILMKLTTDEKKALEIHFTYNEPAKSNFRSVFTKSEDEMLVSLVEKYGTHSWGSFLKCFPGRKVRQLRERYTHYLAPNVNRKDWTVEEDAQLIKLYKENGPKWVKIASIFKNRSDISIKNRWISLMRKGIISNTRSEAIETFRNQIVFPEEMVSYLDDSSNEDIDAQFLRNFETIHFDEYFE